MGGGTRESELLGRTSHGGDGREHVRGGCTTDRCAAGSGRAATYRPVDFDSSSCERQSSVSFSVRSAVSPAWSAPISRLFGQAFTSR